MSGLGVALVGAGGIAQIHAKAIAAVEDVSVAGVFDVDRDRAAALAARAPGACVFGSWAEVLGAADVDVVAVLLPPDLHQRYATEAMAAGHDVFCEKPLGRTVAECEAMLEVEARTGRLLLPGHNRVFEPANERMGEAVRSGALGRVFLAQSNGLEPPALLDRIPWLRDERSRGGVLMAQAVHPIYVLLWLLGPMAALQATRVRPNTQEMVDEDTAVVALEFASGAVGALTATFAQSHGPLGHEIVLSGTGGWLRSMDRRLFDERGEVSIPEGSSFERLWVDVAAAVRRQSAPRQSSAAGLAAVRVVTAAYESMATGRRVSLA